MIRRLAHAAAAVIAVIVTSMVWAPPAYAAPSGLCTLAEWRNPAHFADCAGRLGKQAGDTVGCVGAPMPGSPTSGLPGLFSTRPESSMRSGVNGPPNGNPSYSEYGVGGFGLDTYDLGCLSDLKHPGVSTWNMLASAEFWLAASVISAANGLRQWAYEPSSLLGWADEFVATITDAIFRYVFSVVGVITMVVVGLLIMIRARNGQMSDTVRTAGWALLVLVAVTAVAKWPVTATHAADSVTTAGLGLMHKAAGQGPQHIPADKCVLGPEACVDHRTPAVRASDTVTEAILYRSWLRAVLGTADGPTAEKYGPALYDATTLSWDEQARADQSPALRQQVLDAKAATFNAVAAQLREEDPEAYEHLQGVHGWDRASAGLFALLAALAFAMFDMTASIVVLFGFMVFRIAVVVAPLVGSYGMLQPASSGVRRITDATVASGFNIVIFGGTGALFLTAFQRIYSSPLSPAAQLALTAMLSVACLLVLHPIRHMVSTVTGRSRSEDGLGQRLWNAGREIVTKRPADQPASTSSTTSAPSGEAPTSAPPAPPRPEADTSAPARPEAAPASAPPRPEAEPVSAAPVSPPATGQRSNTAVLTEAFAPSAAGFVKRFTRAEERD